MLKGKYRFLMARWPVFHLMLTVLLLAGSLPSRAGTSEQEVISGLKDEMTAKAVQVDTSAALTPEQLQDVKQYIAYMETLLKKKDVQFDKTAIQQSEKVKEELDKKLQDLKSKVALREQQVREHQQKNTYLKWGIGGLTLFLLPAIMSVIIGRNNRKTKRKNENLEKNNHDIRVAYDYIASSVNYARKIQRSVLVRKTVLDELIPENFLLYEPKEAVSGHFYWFAEVEEKLVVCVAHCSSQGVSGALMSMMGISYLNEVVKGQGETLPDRILSALNSKVKESLSKNEHQVEDCFCITVATLDRVKSTLQLAGASSSLALELRGNITLIDFDTVPVGQMGTETPSFETLTRPLAEVDRLILFTDGVQKQKNEVGEALGKIQFEELLNSRGEDSESHEKRIKDGLRQWQGAADQTDDLLVIGMKL